MKDLHSNKVNIKLFPTIDNVFENLTESHKAVFFPLLTVELNEIEKGNGKVHFISVYGNGNPDMSFSDKNIGYNFIKFKLSSPTYLF